MRALRVGAPDHYLSLLGSAGTEVRWLTRPRSALDFVHLFCRRKKTLNTHLQRYRPRIRPDGTIWVSWPKKASGVASEVTEDTVRHYALPLGLVDIKVCAVDEIWSGLKLVIRKELR